MSFPNSTISTWTKNVYTWCRVPRLNMLHSIHNTETANKAETAIKD